MKLGINHEYGASNSLTMKGMNNDKRVDCIQVV